MRRHIQELGIKKWYGGDYLDLQSEPLKVIDGFFNQFGSHIVSGCRITANGDRFDISPGLVALAGSDPQGAAIRIVAPFAGALSVALPAYLSLDTNTISRLYDDGVNKPVINDYTAVITNLPPAGDYITLASVKVLRFADVIQDSLHRFITDTERIVWNAKETTAGAQEKANAAVQSSKAYTDTREAATRSYADTKDAATLQAAKRYADDTITALVNGSPEALDTLQELANALGNDPNFATTVLNKISGKQDKIAPIQITDFDTFNPLADATASQLLVGESCAFTSYNANGRPSYGGSDSTVDPIRAVYGWTGTITRIYNKVFRIIASSNYGGGLGAQIATRLYEASSATYVTVKNWLMQTEGCLHSNSGFIKLPGGIMIQWGNRTSSASEQTITFPRAFILTPYAVFTTFSQQASTVVSMQVFSITATNFKAAARYSGGYASENFYWLAIGTWR